MPDEPTLGEVMRRLEDVRTDLKDDLREHRERLERKVSLDIFELRMAAVVKELDAIGRKVTEIEQGQAERDRKRAADRRIAFTSLIAPVLILLLTVYINARGAGA